LTGKSGDAAALHSAAKVAPYGAKIKRRERLIGRVEPIAFSSEVNSGSREENASKQKARTRF
jgi:hypothetical protein